VAESSVAAGIRRIEAVTGQVAHEVTQKEHQLLETIRETLNTSIEGLPTKINDLLKEKKILEKQLQEFRAANAQHQIKALAATATALNGFHLLAASVEVQNVDELKQLSDKLRTELKSGVGVLGSIINNKVNFVCVVTDDLIKNKQLNAGKIVSQVAQIAGGSGGGKPHQALAGGKDIHRMNMALQSVKDIVKSMLTA